MSSKCRQQKNDLSLHNFYYVVIYSSYSLGDFFIFMRMTEIPMIVVDWVFYLIKPVFHRIVDLVIIRIGVSEFLSKVFSWTCMGQDQIKLMTKTRNTVSGIDSVIRGRLFRFKQFPSFSQPQIFICAVCTAQNKQMSVSDLVVFTVLAEKNIRIFHFLIDNSLKAFDLPVSFDVFWTFFMISILICTLCPIWFGK